MSNTYNAKFNHVDFVDILAPDESVDKAKLPQIGFYCHQFDKNGKIKRKVKASSIKPLKKDSVYVSLKCQSDGTFALFDEKAGTAEAVDPHSVRCSGKGLRPTLKKHEPTTKLCSEVGADGRTDNLHDTIRYVEIGWNMSAMSFPSETQVAPTKLKDMVNFILHRLSLRTLQIYTSIYMYIEISI